MESPQEWVGRHVEPVAQWEVVRDRTWATTTRIQTRDGPVWFKACAPSHGFEPGLVAELAARWPDLLPVVIAHDTARRWLLLADAGVSFDELGNPPDLWLRLLPLYAELQRSSPVPTDVPDRMLERWPELFEGLTSSPLPLASSEVDRLRAFGPRFAELCGRLADHGLPATLQHDDLHHKNAFVDGETLRIIDWGDASCSHPFVSLVVTFRFLEERNGIARDDPCFLRLRDAYLEPWGRDMSSAFALSQQLGPFVHAFGWVALRELLPESARPAYDVPFAIVLRRALRGV